MNILAAIISFILWIALLLWYVAWLVPKIPMSRGDNDKNWWALPLAAILLPGLTLGELVCLYFLIEQPF